MFIYIILNLNFSATPSILCPDLEASDHEGDVKVPHSMNSTRFDLMAVCSAPTWLGGSKRKSINRRRKSPIPPNSPFPSANPVSCSPLSPTSLRYR